MNNPTPNAPETSSSQPTWWATIASLGPAIVVASVVLGPGSIMVSTKVGCQFGYQMLWIVPLSAFLMFTAVALSARLGSTIDGTICDELSRRCGRWFAALIGITIFLVVALFQSSNNAAFLASLEPFVGDSMSAKNFGLTASVLIGFNLLIIAAVFSLKHLYGQIERLMKGLIAIMLLAFIVNLFIASPDWGLVLQGLIPDTTALQGRGYLPRMEENGEIFDPFILIQALVATTFSVAGAFYQGYLVREKGWGQRELNRGLLDSAVGIATLGVASCMVMITSASVLNGVVPVDELKNTTKVAELLRPTFGPYATTLFAAGIFAAMFSSFAVNAMIGGTLLSDGFGLGASIDMKWPKTFTVLALIVGATIALLSKMLQDSNINVIVYAQALTVLGNPLLAFSLLYLALARRESNVPLWVKVAVAIGAVITLLLAFLKGYRLFLDFMVP